MWVFNSLFGKIFELLFFLFKSQSPWIGIVLISFLTGLFMLFIFRLTSNQEGIRNVKSRIKAHLLELRLFKDSLSISLKAQGNILRLNLKYIGYSAKPMAVMIIPLLLILIQLNFYFSVAPLNPGQTALLKVKLKEGFNPLETVISAEPSSGIVLETLPLRMEEEREINWRFSAKNYGNHFFAISSGNKKVIKSVSVSKERLIQISPRKTNSQFINQILFPAEPPLPGDSPIDSIEITYPSQNMNFMGLHIHWLVAFFILSILFGFAFKGVFKVEI